MSLSTINNDVVLLIISFFKPYDALSLSETCRQFHVIALAQATPSVALRNHQQLTACCMYMLSGPSNCIHYLEVPQSLLRNRNFTNPRTFSRMLRVLDLSPSIIQGVSY
ncbi:hypothetical protein BKA93DRAFT_4344 [Sparassis latifolia]